MATVAFEGTSLMNMFVQNCWVVGTQRIISHRGEEEFIEVRTELSDRSVLYLHRTDRDLGSLLKRLMDAFPEDIATPTRSALLDGLVRIRDAAEANDIEIRLQEVEKLLRRVFTLPIKYSRSEAVLTFFEQSPLDLMIRENNINNMEPYYQSPVTISVHHRIDTEPCQCPHVQSLQVLGTIPNLGLRRPWTSLRQHQRLVAPKTKKRLSLI
ncbi:PX domain-containing protein 1 isoform X2 [Salmo salar]|uniref:PX domain-containing protein 1 isoform X2 n=1 Tax=Salmo salar TaxID=8030 RepID=A0A1S3QX63_SALSA|nr:PX domain-containing protein 1-like isoform X2 [Salmo salar]|eukprot:XP_014044029.1 PREDICTED: PX domain-containing protein 1-like isoform X2 [Salmo salar]